MRGTAEATFETALPPDRVIASLTDFSPQRAEIWPALDPERFEVHELGDTWALVTEGSRQPNVWATERYSWATAGTVSWRAEKSNFSAPGSGTDVTAAETPTGGSRVHVRWQRESTSVTGLLIVMLFRLLGRRLLVGTYKPVWDGLALADTAGPRPT